MNRLNSLIEQAVNKVSIEGGFARGLPSTHKNYGTAVKLPCGSFIFFKLHNSTIIYTFYINFLIIELVQLVTCPGTDQTAYSFSVAT